MDKPSNQDLLANSKHVTVAQSYQDIDRQISDLESIIKRLQEELTGMLNANDTNKQIECLTEQVEIDKEQIKDDKEQIEGGKEQIEGDEKHIDNDKEQFEVDKDQIEARKEQNGVDKKQIKASKEHIEGDKEQNDASIEQLEGNKEKIDDDRKLNIDPTTDVHIVDTTASGKTVTEVINKESTENFVYPIAIKDIEFDLSNLLVGSSQNIPPDTKTPDNSNEYKSIREQFSVLWNEVRAETENKSFSISEYDMHNILAQIKEEVSTVREEKGQRLNNSMESLE